MPKDIEDAGKAILQHIYLTHAQALVRLEHFYQVARLGFNYIRVLPDVQEDSRKLQEFIKYRDSQRPSFYDLQAICTVRMCSILEVFVFDTLKCILSFDDEAVVALGAKRIKGDLISFARMNKHNQSAEILRHLRNTIQKKSRFQHYEDCFKAIGIAGNREKFIEQEIDYRYASRNLIVHEDGVIGEKFVAQWPGLADGLGMRIGIEPEVNRRAYYCFLWYFHEILRRISIKYEIDVRDLITGGEIDGQMEKILHCARNPAEHSDFPDMPDGRDGSD